MEIEVKKTYLFDIEVLEKDYCFIILKWSKNQKEQIF